MGIQLPKNNANRIVCLDEHPVSASVLSALELETGVMQDKLSHMHSKKKKGRSLIDDIIKKLVKDAQKGGVDLVPSPATSTPSRMRAHVTLDSIRGSAVADGSMIVRRRRKSMDAALSQAADDSCPDDDGRGSPGEVDDLPAQDLQVSALGTTLQNVEALGSVVLAAAAVLPAPVDTDEIDWMMSAATPTPPVPYAQLHGILAQHGVTAADARVLFAATTLGGVGVPELSSGADGWEMFGLTHPAVHAAFRSACGHTDVNTGCPFVISPDLVILKLSSSPTIAAHDVRLLADGPQGNGDDTQQWVPTGFVSMRKLLVPPT